MNDDFIFDPDALDSTADMIEMYCRSQKSILETYLANMSTISSAWTDEITVEPILNEVRSICEKLNDALDGITSTAPRYFRSRAQTLRDRPKSL